LTIEGFFGPFVLISRLPGHDGEVFRARRAVVRGGVSGPVRLSRLAADEPVDPWIEEADRGARAALPGVVRVLEVGRAEGATYAVGEIAEGVDLASILVSARSSSEPVPVSMALAIASQLAGVAAELREAGVPVECARPTDVIVCWDGRVRLRLRGQPEDGGRAHGFIAPELRDGSGLSQKTDTWAVSRLLRATLASDPEGKRTPKISQLYKENLGALLTGGLARNPTLRPTVFELRRGLLELVEPAEGSATQAVATWVTERLGGRPPDDDAAVLTEDILSDVRDRLADADDVELLFPRGSAPPRPSRAPKRNTDVFSDVLASASGEGPSTAVGPAPGGDISSSVFGRILEDEGAGEPGEGTSTRSFGPPSFDDDAVEEEDLPSELDRVGAGVDLDAIARMSLADGAPEPSDTAVTPLSDEERRSLEEASLAPAGTDVMERPNLGEDEDDLAPMGTDVMEAPAELRADADAGDGLSDVFASDEGPIDELAPEDASSVFAAPPQQTRADRSRPSAEALSSGRGSGSEDAIFTRAGRPGARSSSLGSGTAADTRAERPGSSSQGSSSERKKARSKGSRSTTTRRNRGGEDGRPAAGPPPFAGLSEEGGEVATDPVRRAVSTQDVFKMAEDPGDDVDPETLPPGALHVDAAVGDGGQSTMLLARPAELAADLDDAEEPEVDPDRTAFLDSPGGELSGGGAFDMGKAPTDPEVGAVSAGSEERTAYIDHPAAEPPPQESEERTAYVDHPGDVDDDEVEVDPDRTAALESPPSLRRKKPALRGFADHSSEETATGTDVDEDDLYGDRTEQLSRDDVQEALRRVKAAKATLHDPPPEETALLPVEDVREVLRAGPSAFFNRDEKRKKAIARQHSELGDDDDGHPPTLDELLPEDPELGLLVVDVPDGAVVFLNGEEQGRGRTVVHDLDRFITYNVRVHLRGYSPWVGTVTLRGMRAARVEPEFQAR
jgi:hypothetical protein